MPRVLASKLLPPEFRKKPSVYTPEPNSTPTVVVADTALPSPSTTARCDVKLWPSSAVVVSRGALFAEPVRRTADAGYGLYFPQLPAAASVSNAHGLPATTVSGSAPPTSPARERAKPGCTTPCAGTRSAAGSPRYAPASAFPMRMMSASFATAAPFSVNDPASATPAASAICSISSTAAPPIGGGAPSSVYPRHIVQSGRIAVTG